MVTLLDSGTPQAWASKHGLTHPVLSVDSSVTKDYWKGGYYPNSHTVQTMMVVKNAEIHPGSVGNSHLDAIVP